MYNSQPDSPPLADSTDVASLRATIAQLNQQLHQCQQALHRPSSPPTEERLSQILNRAAVSITSFQLGADGTWMDEYWSEGCEAVFGYTAHELMADRHLWRSRLWPEDREAIVQPAIAALPFTPSVSIDYRFHHKDGTLRWIHSTFTVQPEGLNTGWLAVAVNTDISAQKQVEIAWKRQVQIMDQIHDSVIATDVNGVITSWNQGSERLLGYTADEMIGQSIARIYPADQHDVLRDQVMQPALDHGEHTIDVRLQKKSGELLDGHLALSTLTNADGDVIGLIGYTLDISERKRLEAEQCQIQADLRESEARQRAILSVLPYLVNIVRSDGVFLNFITANAVLDLVPPAVKREGRSLFEFLPEDLARRAVEAIQRAIATGDIQRYEQQVQLAGQTRFEEVCIVPMDGDRALSLVQDITDRKHAEIALQQLNHELEDRVLERTQELTRSQALSQRNETLLRATRHIARLGSWECDLVAKQITWSDDMFDIFGRDRLQSVPTFQELSQRYIHPTSRDTYRQAIDRAIQCREPYTLDLHIMREDGSSGYLFVRGQPMVDAEGTVTRLLGVVMDITDRKLAEEALRQSEQRLSMALTAANAGIWEWPIGTDQGYWSDENYRLLGYEPQSCEPNYASWVAALHPDDRATAIAQVEEAIAHRHDLNIEFRVLLPDQSVRWVADIATLFYDAEGNPERMIGIQIDISDRKYAALVLQRQANREQLLRTITQRIHQSLDLNEILLAAVTDTRQMLNADRVAIYRFNPDWSGQFIAESAGEGWTSLVDPTVQRVWEDTYLQVTQGGRYAHDETFAVDDIYTIGHARCHLDLLEQFQARAYAIAPVFSRGKLWGLLATYQNSGPRHWEAWEIELLRQIGTQLAIAIQQASLYRQMQTELSDRIQIDEQLRASLREKEVLLKEIHHRVKNNLQIVSSLLNLQASTIQDPVALEPLLESQRRIKAMALIHERLYRTDDFARINFSDYVTHLVADLFQSYLPMGKPIDVAIQVAAVDLGIDVAIPCGLIINELVSNALKHAFTDGRTGAIQIAFASDSNNVTDYTLTIQDNGVGLPQQLDVCDTESLGLQIVWGLVEQLEGRLDVDRSMGTTFKITFSNVSE